MDVPSPFAGVVKELKVKVGDKVSEGSLIAVDREQRCSAARRRPASSSAVCTGRCASQRRCGKTCRRTG